MPDSEVSVTVSGPMYAYLLGQGHSSAGDSEGLLFGSHQHISTATVTDNDANASKTELLSTIELFVPTGPRGNLYGPDGSINVAGLKSHLKDAASASASGQPGQTLPPKCLGWYRFVRNRSAPAKEQLRLSAMEVTVTKNLAALDLSDKKMVKVFVLITVTISEDNILDQNCQVFRTKHGKMQPVATKIQNLGATGHSEYHNCDSDTSETATSRLLQQFTATTAGRRRIEPPIATKLLKCAESIDKDIDETRKALDKLEHQLAGSTLRTGTGQQQPLALIRRPEELITYPGSSRLGGGAESASKSFASVPRPASYRSPSLFDNDNDNIKMDWSEDDDTFAGGRYPKRSRKPILLPDYADGEESEETYESLETVPVENGFDYVSNVPASSTKETEGVSTAPKYSDVLKGSFSEVKQDFLALGPKNVDADGFPVYNPADFISPPPESLTPAPAPDANHRPLSTGAPLNELALHARKFDLDIEHNFEDIDRATSMLENEELKADLTDAINEEIPKKRSSLLLQNSADSGTEAPGQENVLVGSGNTGYSAIVDYNCAFSASEASALASTATVPHMKRALESHSASSAEADFCAPSSPNTSSERPTSKQPPKKKGKDENGPPEPAKQPIGKPRTADGLNPVGRAKSPAGGGKVNAAVAAFETGGGRGRGRPPSQGRGKASSAAAGRPGLR